MTYLQHQRNPLHSVPGMAAVVALHIALIYALVYGLRTTSAPDYIPPPIKAHVEPTIIVPPPPPPPPSEPVLITPRTPTLPVPTIDLPTPLAPPTLTLPRGTDATQPLPQPNATAPADHKFQPAAILSGAPSPAYPEAYSDAPHDGRVTVDCMIETTGVPTNCRVIAQTGGPAFATETLRWLTGPTHPTYSPAVRDGQPRREEHQWAITFLPAD
jgi:periplasmic protein TonB